MQKLNLKLKAQGTRVALCSTRVALVLACILSFASGAPQIRAQSAATTFTESVVTTGSAVILPSIPTGLAVAPVSQSEIDLSWNPSTASAGIAGYVVFRDNSPLATTTNVYFDDTLLTASTTYTYAVQAFDTLSNYSALSAPVSTSTLPIPIIVPTPTSTPILGSSGSGAGSSLVYDVHTSADSDSATLSFMTALPAQSTVSWGLTPDYEIGSISSVLYDTSHQVTLSGLTPETHYYVRITVSATDGSLSSFTTEFTTAGLAGTPLPNPSNFTAVPSANTVNLSWTDTTDPRATGVRIVRSETFFPSDQFDGVPVYEGSGQSFRDSSVKAGKTYYYAIFSEGAGGLFSSGALSKVRIPLPGESVSSASSSNPFAGITFASNVNPMIAGLTLTDFEFIQGGKDLSLAGNNIVSVNGEENMTIRLPYGKVPQILKTIAVSLNDPTDPSKAFIFLLRANADQTYYEASIGPLGRTGVFPLTITILDYQNQGLKQLSGSLAAAVINAVPMSSDFDQLYLWFGLALLIVLPVISIKLKKGRNVEKKKSIEISVAMVLLVSLTSLIPYFLASFIVHASYNPEINYQGKLANSSNVAVADGSYNMEFKLYTTATGATTSAIWTEDDLVSNNQGVSTKSGLFSVMLGSTTPLTGVNFNQTLYLGVNIGGTGSSPSWDSEMSPRKIIGTVPAAFVSGTSTVALSANTLQNLTPGQFFRNDINNATSSATTSLSILQTGAGKIAEFFGASLQSVLSILSNGYVGIGSSTPSNALEVNGNEYIAGNSTSSYYTATSTTATSTFAGGLSVAGTSGLTVSQNGFVGIGTNKPSFPLNVVGSSGSTYINIDNTTGTGGLVAGFQLQTNGATNSVYTTSGGDLYWDANNVASGVFQMVHSGAVANTLVLKLGDVGIATTSPSNKLEVNGNGYFGGNLTAANVTATGTLAVTGATTLASSLNGFVQATNGLLSATTSPSLNALSGVLGVSNGGTGQSSYTDGQLLIGNSLTNGLTPATLTGTSNEISITNGHGTITLSTPQAIGTASTPTFASTTLSNFTSGSIVFAGASGALNQNNANLFWDNVNNRLGIGTTTPQSLLSVYQNTNSANFTTLLNQSVYSPNSGYTDSFTFQVGANSNRGGGIHFGETGSAFNANQEGIDFGLNAVQIYQAGNYPISLYTNATESGGSVTSNPQLTVLGNGNVGIGTTSPSNKLEVNGNGYFGGNLTAANVTATGTLTVGGNFNIAGVYYSNGNKIIDNVGNFFAQGPGTEIISNTGAVSFTTGTFTGNVGIGTTSPSNRLEVSGNTFLGGNLTATGTLTVSGSASSTFAGSVNSSSGNLVLQSNGTANNILLNAYGGNVGIGTTNPIVPLQIELNGSTNNTDLFIHDTNGSTNTGPGMAFGIRSGTNTEEDARIAALRTDLVSSGDTDLLFSTLHSSLSEKMRITAAGNVGIGTTSPTNKLEVAGNVYIGGTITATGTVTMPSFSSDGNLVHSDGFGTLFTNALRLQDGNNLYWGSTPMIGAVANSYLAFSVNSSEKMRILNNGNVGIGTTSPSANLSIQSTNGLAATSSIFTIASSTPSGLSTTTLLTVLGNGNVGIGTPSPQSVLDIRNTSNAADALRIVAYSTQTNPLLSILKSDNSSYLTKFYPNISATGNDSAYSFDTANTLTTANVANFLNNGNSKLVIQGSGNVGIGSSTPSNALEVNGNGYFGGNISANSFISTGSATSTFAWAINLTAGCFAINNNCISGGGGSSQWTTSGSNIYYTGNVGIGTSTTPASPLTIITSSGNNPTALSVVPYNYDSGSNAGYVKGMGMTIGNGAGSANMIDGYGYIYGNRGDTGAIIPYLAFKGTGGVQALTNFGIKNNNFIQTTDTGGLGVSVNLAGMSSGNVVQIGTNYDLHSTNWWSYPTQVYYGGDLNNTPGYLKFTMEKHGVSTDVGAFDNNGNFGIGTTSPLAKLDIAGTLGSSIDLFNISSTTATNIVSSLFRVKSNGNVGIGTSSPSNALEVNGSGYFAGNLTFSSLISTSTAATSTFADTIKAPCFSTDGVTCLTSGSGTNYWTSSGGNIYNNTGTDVGIATSTPSNALEVNGNGYFNGNLTVAKLTASSTSYLIGKVGIATSTPSNALEVNGNGYFNGNLKAANVTATGTLSVFGESTFKVPDTDYNPTLNLVSPENTYGNTNNLYLTDSNSGAQWLFGVNSNSSTYPNSFFFNKNGTSASLYVGQDGTLAVGGPITSISGNLVLQSNGTSNGVILNPYGGSVGIGNSSPQYPLDVSTIGNSTGNFNVKTPNGGDGVNTGDWGGSANQVSIITGTGGNGVDGDFETPGGAGGNGGDITIETGDGGSNGADNGDGTGSSGNPGTVHILAGGTNGDGNVLLQEDGGDVGIDNSSPGHTLDVGGDIYASSDVCSSSACLSEYSDARLKTNIAPLGSTLDSVMKLVPITYNWNDIYLKDHLGMSNATSTQLGFIAQDVQGLFPDIVTMNNNGYLSIEYEKFAPILAEAIKEQQGQIGALSSTTESIATSTTASLQNLSDAIASMNLRIDALASATSSPADSLDISEIASSTADFLLNATSSIGNASATSTPSFIDSVASAVMDLIKSTGNWVIAKLTATVIIANDIQTQTLEAQSVKAATASVTDGLEMTDSATGQVYCVRITNGNFDKTLGTCSSTATSTTPIVQPIVSTSTTSTTTSPTTTQPSYPTSTATSTPPVIQPIVSTSTTSTTASSTTPVIQPIISTSTTSTTASSTTPVIQPIVSTSTDPLLTPDPQPVQSPTVSSPTLQIAPPATTPAVAPTTPTVTPTVVAPTTAPTVAPTATPTTADVAAPVAPAAPAASSGSGSDSSSSSGSDSGSGSGQDGGGN